MINTTLIGRIGKDIEVRDVSGKKVGNFSVAVDTGYGDKKTTLWVDAALWDKPNLYQYLKKGTQVYIQGEPSVREYPKKDGTKGFSLSLRVDRIELLGGKSDSTATTQQQPAPIQEPEESLPF